MCEKPLGVNLKEVKEMQADAKLRGLFLQEANWTRFFPLLKKLRKMIHQDGVIGEVKHVQADFGVEFPSDVKRIWNLDTAGGALLDLGCYPISFLSWALGEEVAREVLEMKTSGKLDEGTGVDVFGNICLRYKENKSAVVSWSGLVTLPEEVTVSGSLGYVRILGPAHCPTKAVVARRSGRGFEFEEVKEDLPFENGKDCEFNFPNSVGFVYEIEECERAIKGGKLCCEDYTWGESCVTAMVMDRARSEMGLHYPAENGGNGGGGGSVSGGSFLGLFGSNFG